MGPHGAQLSLLELDELLHDARSKATKRSEATQRDNADPSVRRKARRSDANRRATPPDSEALLTTAEAADLLRVHPRTIQRLVARGELVAVHLGGAVRFERQDVTELIARLKCARGGPVATDRARRRNRTMPATVSGSFRDRVRAASR